MFAPLLVVQLAALGLALALDLTVGDPPNRWHPVAWMGATIAAAKKLAPRTGAWPRFLFGVALVLLGAALWTLPVFLLDRAARHWSWLFTVPLTALLLKSAFSFRGLLRAAGQVRQALQAGDLDSARRLVSWHLVSRDTRTLDANLVAAATVESVAESLTDSLVAPLFYFALLGLPGAWAYRFFNTCDSMLGYRDPEHEFLGKFAARWDDVLNWIPARLAGLLLWVAAGLAGENAAGAWRTMWAQHGRTASPNAGWTMSAMAGALNVTLEKVGHYRLTGGETPADASLIGRAQRVASVGAALTCLLLGGLLILKGVLFYG